MRCGCSTPLSVYAAGSIDPQGADVRAQGRAHGSNNAVGAVHRALHQRPGRPRGQAAGADQALVRGAGVLSVSLQAWLLQRRSRQQCGLPTASQQRCQTDEVLLQLDKSHCVYLVAGTGSRLCGRRRRTQRRRISGLAWSTSCSAAGRRRTSRGPPWRAPTRTWRRCWRGLRRPLAAQMLPGRRQSASPTVERCNTTPHCLVSRNLYFRSNITSA